MINDRRIIRKFEDLEIWKEGMSITLRIYQALSKCRDYSLRDQIQRAAVSIPSNIAEGYERNTNKDFIRFLHISQSSCSELRTQIYLAIEIGRIGTSVGEDILESTRKISAMLHSYIRTRMEKF